MQNSIVYRLTSVHYFNPLLRKLESTFLSYELCNTGAFWDSGAGTGAGAGLGNF